jgi:hypothetical protein
MNQPSQKLPHVNGENAVSENANRNGFSSKYGISNGHNDNAVKMKPLNTSPSIKIHKNESSNQQPTQSFQYLESTSPQSFRTRCDSMTAREDDDQNESKVLVIYTGGTIGMMRNDEDSKYIVFISIVQGLGYYLDTVL